MRSGLNLTERSVDNVGQVNVKGVALSHAER